MIKAIKAMLCLYEDRTFFILSGKSGIILEKDEFLVKGIYVCPNKSFVFG